MSTHVLINTDSPVKLIAALKYHHEESEVIEIGGIEQNSKLLKVLRNFLEGNREWSVVDASVDMVRISKRSQDKQPLPLWLTQAWNYTRTAWREYWYGRKLVTTEVAEERLSHCWLCVHRNNNQCTLCGCYLDKIPEDSSVEPNGPGKALRAGESCPMGLWLRVRD